MALFKFISKKSFFSLFYIENQISFQFKRSYKINDHIPETMNFKTKERNVVAIYARIYASHNLLDTVKLMEYFIDITLSEFISML